MQPDSQQATHVINAVDLSLPKTKVLGLNRHWCAEHADAAVKAYRQFLYLAWRYGAKTRLVPHLSVDEVWHQHILCTRAYTVLCTELLGAYYHHSPSEGQGTSAQDAADYRRTCALLVHHFGAQAHPEKVFAPFYPHEKPLAAQ